MLACFLMALTASASERRRFAVSELRVMELLRRAGERPQPGDYEALSFWVRHYLHVTC